MRDWIIVITLLYEKTLKSTLVEKKIHDREALELKIYNHYLDKRKQFMKNTEIKVEEVLGDIIKKDKMSHDQIIKLKNFSAKLM